MFTQTQFGEMRCTHVLFYSHQAAYKMTYEAIPSRFCLLSSESWYPFCRQVYRNLREKTITHHISNRLNVAYPGQSIKAYISHSTNTSLLLLIHYLVYLIKIILRQINYRNSFFPAKFPFLTFKSFFSKTKRQKFKVKKQLLQSYDKF